MENSCPKCVLLVDDEEKYLCALVDDLRVSDCDATILTAENGKKGLSVLESARIDLVVTDLQMPVMDGFEFISEVKKRHPSMPIIVMSTALIPAMEKRLSALGVSHCFEKFNVNALTDQILRAVKNRSDRPEANR